MGVYHGGYKYILTGTEGVIGIAGKTGYFNGGTGQTIPAGNLTHALASPLYIMYGTSAYVQGFVAYNTAITSDQMVALSTAMNGTYFGSGLTASENTTASYYKFGSKSLKLVTANTGAYVTSINAGNTNTHTLSAYVYDGTTGNVGGTVSATVAKLVFNGSAQTTTYTDMGGGWWRLTYSAAAGSGAQNYGVEVQAGKTVYVDGFQLEEKAYATTYADGSLGSGYSWTGTANASTSTRAISNLQFSISNNISATAGSVSFWLKSTWAGNDSLNHVVFDTDTSAGTLKLIKNSSNNLILTDGTNSATVAVSWTANTWQHIAADWGSSNLHIYLNSAAGTAGGAYSAPTLTTSLYLGQDKTNANLLNAQISDLRVYNAILSSTQVADIYYAGLISRQDTYATGTVDNFQEYPKDGNGTNKITNPSFENGTFSTNWAATQAYTLQDEFTDTVAAGSVNGTTAKDAFGISTGATRIVRDVENKLSLTGGKLSFQVQTTPASAEEDIFNSTAITRTPGRMFISTDVTSEMNNLAFQHVVATTSTTTYANEQISGIFYKNYATLYGPGTLSIGTLSTPSYSYMTILRTSGEYIFIKGGTYIDWTLLYYNSTRTGTPCYFGASSYDTNYTIGAMRVPTSTWLPTPLAYDTFSSAGSAVTEATGPDGASGPAVPQLTWTGGTKSGGKMSITPTLGDELITNGGFDSDTAWSKDGFTISDGVVNTTASWGRVYQVVLTTGQWYWHSFDIVSSTSGYISAMLDGGIPPDRSTVGTFISAGRSTGRFGGLVNKGGGEGLVGTVDNVSIKPLTLSSLFSTVSTSDANVIADVTISAATAGTQAGLVLNLDSTSSPANFIIVYHDGTKLYVDEAVNGVYTNKQNTTVALGAGALRVVRDGTKLRAYLNNSLVGAELTMTANTNTRHGLFSTYSGNTFDNFSLFARGSDGEYSGIPAEPSDLLTAAANTTYKKFGTQSVRLVNSSTAYPFQYVTSINAGNTNTHTLSAYVYTNGQAVTSADAKLVFNGSVVTPSSYTKADGGWYRLTYSAAGTASAANYGVEVQAGKTVYLDAVQLEENATATSYMHGSLGRGYSWTSTANNSSSTRTAGSGKGEKPTSVWHMDEGYGTQAGDASPNLHHLTISGATWTDSGSGGGVTRGKYLSFDGTDDKLSRPFDRDFDFGTGEFTIAGMFKHPSTVSGTDTILARQSGSTGYKVYMNSSGYVCFSVNSDSACTTTSYADSKWHSFSAVRSASTLTLYVDTVQKAGTNQPSPATVNGNNTLYVGIDSDGTSNPWAGFLDEMAIYPYARTAVQTRSDSLGKQVSTLIGSRENDNLSDGLVGYWKMDETSGTLSDSSGNGNTGTWSGTGASHYTTGKFANGGGFNGTDDRISATTTGFSNTSGTVSMWVKPTSGAAANYFVFAMRSGDERLYINTNSAGTVLTGTLGATTIGTATVTVNTWNHITLTWNGRTGTMFVNGVNSTTTSSFTAFSSLSGASAFIGSYTSGGENYKGTMDEVRIYNRALSPAEVTQLYEWAPGPVVKLEMDEGSGTTLYDSSGNSRNGTLNGNPTWINAKYGKGVRLDGTGDFVQISDF